MPAPQAAVIDASVGAKLFLEEPFSDNAHALFLRLANDPPASFFVPDLFYIECTNILVKYTRRFGLPAETSQANLHDLQQLLLNSIPTAELVGESFSLAIELNLTAYDACYAALARRLQIPLITADRALAQAVSWAVWLGDIQTSP